jgi:GAF domain-containing protein
MNAWSWIKKLFAPPVFEGDDEKTRNAALLNILLWTMLAGILIVFPFLAFASTSFAALVWTVVLVAAFALPIIGLMRMARRGHVQRAGVLVALLLWLITTAGVVVFGGIRSTTAPVYLVAIFVTGLLLGRGAVTGLGLLTAASLLAVYLLEYHSVQVGSYQIPVYSLPAAVGPDNLFMLLVAVVITGVVVSLSRRSLINALRRAQANERALGEVNRQLEARSEELQARTRDLARRSMQLQVAADISRDVIAVRELDELLDRAVNLVRDRFGFYHVALYLVDEQNEYALLQAATGEAGRQMLEQERPIDLEQEGLFGYVINSGYHCLLFDVGDDAVRFENPLLPETRSELALPLRVGMRIIGALDIQSRSEEAFDGDDVAVLQSMTDQFAVAIENARLLSEMQHTLHELEVASGLYTQDSWRLSAQRRGRGTGYRYRRLGVERAADPPPEAIQAWADGRSVVLASQPDAADDGQKSISTLAVPVKLRDQVVGVLNLSIEGRAVASDTVALVEEVANRLALALENARLLDETRQRAQRDRLIADITAQVRATMDVERILQTAVRGLGAALGSERAFIKLGGAEGRLATGTGSLNAGPLNRLPDDGGLNAGGEDERTGERAAGATDERASEAASD